jgi:hypothetical protein
MRVVAPPGSYAERKQLLFSFYEGLFAGALFVLCIGHAAISLIRGQQVQDSRFGSMADVLASPEGIIGLALVLLFIAAILWMAQAIPRIVYGKMDERIEAYRLGKEGKDRVVEKARQALDGNWVLLRNVALPGRRRAELRSCRATRSLGCRGEDASRAVQECR